MVVVVGVLRTWVSVLLRSFACTDAARRGRWGAQAPGFAGLVTARTIVVRRPVATFSRAGEGICRSAGREDRDDASHTWRERAGSLRGQGNRGLAAPNGRLRLPRAGWPPRRPLTRLRAGELSCFQSRRQARRWRATRLERCRSSAATARSRSVVRSATRASRRRREHRRRGLARARRIRDRVVRSARAGAHRPPRGARRRRRISVAPGPRPALDRGRATPDEGDRLRRRAPRGARRRARRDLRRDRPGTGPRRGHVVGGADGLPRAARRRSAVCCHRGRTHAMG